MPGASDSNHKATTNGDVYCSGCGSCLARNGAIQCRKNDCKKHNPLGLPLAFHLIGHAVIAESFPTAPELLELTFTSKSTGAGYIPFRSLENYEPSRDELISTIINCLAMSDTNRILNPDSNSSKDQDAETNRHCYILARIIAKQFDNCALDELPAQTEKILAECRDQASQIVGMRQKAICKMTEMLIAKGHITGEEFGSQIAESE